MPNILVRSAELYVDKLQIALNHPIDLGVTRRLFPSLDSADVLLANRLISSMLALIPLLGSAIVDKDNLPDERSRMAIVFTYLIMPFDILPSEQYGLLGYLDDALIAHLLASKITESDDAIVAVVAASQVDVAQLMTKLPDWFTDAISRFVAQAQYQQSTLQSPMSKLSA